ncbi:DUF5085 family protein [Leifsonia aquatica]|uniref:DUF5085 family protein n=1 Tax=Leifsonia aquatica TaxID=144185 RepID=UPI00384D8006
MESVFRGVTFGEMLASQNVVSSRATFHYSELADRFDGFLSAVAARGYDPTGSLFYSLNNVPLDEVVDVEMFLPVRQDKLGEFEGILFHTYFEVAPLLRGTVTGDFENQTERVYAELLATMEENDVEINSPFFHVVYRDVSPYASVLVGYTKRPVGGGPSR